MTRFAGVLTLALSLAATAQAVPVTFTTDAMFGMANQSTLTVGSTTISFNSASAMLNTPSLTTLGQIVVNSTAATDTFDPLTDYVTLIVNQSTPGPAGSLAFIGRFSGTISEAQGNAYLTFTPTTGTINGVVYDIVEADVNFPGRVAIVPENTVVGGMAGVTGIQAHVSAPIPEPATYALIGLGLASLGLVRRVRT